MACLAIAQNECHRSSGQVIENETMPFSFNIKFFLWESYLPIISFQNTCNQIMAHRLSNRYVKSKIVNTFKTTAIPFVRIKCSCKHTKLLCVR